MSVKNVEKVDSINVGGVEYSVVKFRNENKIQFGTIDKKYIKNGKLNTTITGIHLLISDTRDGAIKNREDNIESYNYMMKTLNDIVNKLKEDMNKEKDQYKKDNIQLEINKIESSIKDLSR